MNWPELSLVTWVLWQKFVMYLWMQLIVNESQKSLDTAKEKQSDVRLLICNSISFKLTWSWPGMLDLSSCLHDFLNLHAGHILRSGSFLFRKVSVDVPVEHELRGEPHAAVVDYAAERLVAQVANHVPLQPRVESGRLPVDLTTHPLTNVRRLFFPRFFL